jgi:nucleoside 2-deoxyribosyltransferase
MISSSIAKVVIAGTFRRSSRTLKQQYYELIETNCQVLSPRSLDFDAAEFVRAKSESRLDTRAIEDNHLASIEEADFLWLHAPDGYVGLSGAFEIGYAQANNIPVFSKSRVTDGTIGNYVTVCGSVYEAKCQVLGRV